MVVAIYKPRFLLGGVKRHFPYEDFICDFTCEKRMELEHFHIWNFHFTHEIRRLHVKYLIHMWNKYVQKYTWEMLILETCASHMKWEIHKWKLISQMKFSFHIWNWNTFVYEILFSHVKWHVKFSSGLRAPRKVFASPWKFHRLSS